MIETITTNDRVQHTIAKTIKTNAQEMIVADHPRETAPTPRRAAHADQAITTETVHHSMKEKKILYSLLDYHAPRSTTEK
jgi:hypothetical protein